ASWRWRSAPRSSPRSCRRSCSAPAAASTPASPAPSASARRCAKGIYCESPARAASGLRVARLPLAPGSPRSSAALAGGVLIPQPARRVPSRGVPEFNRRFAWLIGVVATAFLVLAGRLWQLQILRGEAYYQKASDNFRAERFLPAGRGKIEDRRGRILVDNPPSFNADASPRYFTPAPRERLVQLLGLPPGDAEALREKVRKSRAQEVLVLEDIGRDQLALVAQAQSELPGVAVHDVPHRNYLYGTLAA